MKQFPFCALQVVALAAFAGVPVVQVDSVSESGARVTVNYTLAGEPGVVTFAAQTNNGVAWVEIEDKSVFRYCSGDVSRFVEPGSHTLVWRANRAWCGQTVSNRGFRVVLKAWATNAPPDYLVADLTGGESARYYEYAESLPDGISHSRYKESKMVFRKIPAAGVEWTMGLTTYKPSQTVDPNFRPHQVTLSRDYYFAIYPVTQRQYAYIAGSYPTDLYPSNPDPDHRPVVDAPRGDSDIATLLADFRKATGVAGVLPTEAQWEYACRAGTTTEYYNGEDQLSAEEHDSYVWSPGKAAGTRAVGQTIPNDWGIHDLYGQAWDLCGDYFQMPYPEGPVTDPVGTGTHRACRGGNIYWGGTTSSGRRLNYGGDVNGFRLSAPAEAVR